MKARLLPLLTFLLITTLACAEDTYKVTKVIDGDTIKLSNGEKVRLIGIDAPEFTDHKRNKRNARRLGIELKHYESYAQRSTDFLKDFIEDRKIGLLFDENNEHINHKDKYGRLLAYVITVDPKSDDALSRYMDKRITKMREMRGDGPQGIDQIGQRVERFFEDFGNKFKRGRKSYGYIVNQVLVDEGFALAYTIYPYKYERDFISRQKNAKNLRKEIWSGRSIRQYDPTMKLTGNYWYELMTFPEKLHYVEGAVGLFRQKGVKLTKQPGEYLLAMDELIEANKDYHAEDLGNIFTNVVYALEPEVRESMEPLVKNEMSFK